MRVLGIDPGSTATGYGILEGSPNRLVHVAHGTLRAPRSAPLAGRLAALHAALQQVIAVHRPDCAVAERVFVAASVRSALVLGQARGAALAAAGAAGLLVAEYSAREVKLAATGSGAAGKRDVQAMVQRLLGLERPPARDAADALAAAICHLYAARLRGAGSLGAGRAARRPRARAGWLALAAARKGAW